MKNLDNLENIIAKFCTVKKSNFVTNTELDKEILGDMMAEYDVTAGTKRVVFGNLRRFIMKSKMKLGTAVAAVVIVCIVLKPLIISSSCFADIVKQFLGAQTAVFEVNIEISGEQTQSMEGMFAEPGRTVLVDSGGNSITTDMQQGKIMILDQAEGKVMMLDITSPGKHPVQRSNPFIAIRDLMSKAQESGTNAIEFLGHKEIEGIPAIGYSVVEHNTSITVWADEQTMLPILIQQLIDMPYKDKIVTINNITYDVELDETLFSLEPPEGYLLDIVADSGQPEFTVMGTVTDAESGELIVGAKISDDRYGPKPYKGAVTDSNGEYEYSTWPEEHAIRAEAPGYKTQRKGLLGQSYVGEDEKKTEVVNFELVRE